MNCFVHDRSAAVGLCSVCQKALCRECVSRETPRLICRTCMQQRAVLGFEYRSRVTIAGWPLIHICAGLDPVTANAPNPAGVALLKRGFADETIGAGGLLLGALGPTLVAAAAFMLL